MSSSRFDSATPGGLSPKKRALLELLLEKQNSAKKAKTIPRRVDPASAPLSFAQERLWFLSQLDPASTAYNIRRALSIRGPLDAARLEAAIARIAERHEVLRSSFPVLSGRPLQIIGTRLYAVSGGASPPAAPDGVNPSGSQRLAFADLSHLPIGERDGHMKAILEEEMRRPFELAEGPLLRAKLLKLAPEEHVLVLAMHHIVSDGWSLGIFFRELAALYGGSEPPETTIQYPDYAAWLRERMTPEHLAGDLRYWTEELAGVAPLELPADRPRPKMKSSFGARKTFVFPARLGTALEGIAKKNGATLFMTLLAAFEVLLHRYSGQSDFAVGTPVAGRGFSQLEELIGCFVNTLVLRADVGGGPTFLELLERVKKRALAAYARQELPFEKLVEALSPNRDLARSPVFQALFVLENTPADHAPQLPGLDVERIELDPRSSQNDLALYIRTEHGALRGYFEYSTDLFERDTIDRFAASLERMLESITVRPELPISRLPILSDKERRRMLVEWNDTTRDYPRGTKVTRLFEAQVERTPDAVAVQLHEDELTYRELNERANRLAHHLAVFGLKPGALVGLCVERSLEMLVGLLGIMKAGYAYVPLDPAFPERRLELMVEDARLPLVVTQQHLAHLFITPIVRLDGEASRIAGCSSANLEPKTPAGADDPLAYVIYTSGSTGRPKGVAVRHRSLTNILVSLQRDPGLSASDVFVAVTTISFDIAALELYLPLISGARVVIARRDECTDGRALIQLLERTRATVMQATPSMWRMLLLAGWKKSPKLRVFCGGEALPADLARDLAIRAQEAHNLYGPTETTIWSAQDKIDPARLDRSTAPIGRPIANTTLHVLDVHLEPLPIGVTGEIYIGGEGVAAGYWGRPDLTAEQFIRDPFAPVGAGASRPGLLYRTGDLARRLRDGRIEFLGRADHQVKLRGYRIELGEIEAVLARHTSVAEVVAIVREDRPGDQRLTAYFTAKAGHSADVEELRALARRRLPEYMVPSALMQLETLPLTPNAKIDRRALPKPNESDPGPSDRSPAAMTPAQLALAEIFAEVVQRDRVGLHDDFFALGGHSLLATQLISRIREKLSAELPLRVLFEAPTVAQLEKHIEPARRRTPALPAMDIASREDELPLSFPQQRLWFLNRFEGETGAYNIPVAFWLNGQLDLGKLDEALRIVVRRHEALRTTFPVAGGGPVQRISPVPATILEIVDARGARADSEEVRKQLAREGERPFDLESELLLRARILVLGPSEHVLLLTMHHVASDGWSIGILLRELSLAYEALSRDMTPELFALPLQYADFAAWQRKYLTKEVLAKELEYWEKQLEGAPAMIELPADRPRPAIQRFRGRTRRFAIDFTTVAKLKRIAERSGATTFMTLLAAFATLLSRLTGQRDISIGSPIANRSSVDCERMIGCFINTLVLRTKLEGEPSFTELLEQVRKTALEAYEHRELPFEHLIEKLQPERNLSHTPVFQVMFVLQNAGRDQLELPGCEVSRFERENTTAKLDLTLWVSETAPGFACGLEYNTDLFDESTIDRFIGCFTTLLEAIARAPGERVTRLPLLSDVERSALIYGLNSTTVEFPRDKLVHELIEAQAERAPHALALELGEKRLNYRELNRRANQLCDHLRTLGVGPNALIGLCVERSIDMVVAMLGILKAGGAYVPLDPTFPSERLNFMIEDSRMRVLISEQAVLQSLDLSVRGLNVVRLDADMEQVGNLPSSTPAPRARPDHLAYVIYTSGSTGRPKAVKIRHRSAVNLLTSMVKEPGIDRKDVVVAVTTIAFDIAAVELLAPLIAGACVVIASREIAADGMRLRELLEHSGATVFQSTPSGYRMLILAGWTGSQKLRAFVGGEPLPGHLAEQILQRSGSAYNLYGPTETTVWSALEKLSLEKVRGRDTVSIGRPIANTQLYVLDENVEPLPAGVRGEIFIGGEGLAEGYLDRPELTDEKFIPNPFSGMNNTREARLYRTGDAGMILPTGAYRCWGASTSR